MPQFSKTFLVWTLLIALSGALGFVVLKSTMTAPSTSNYITPNPIPPKKLEIYQDTASNIAPPIRIINIDRPNAANSQEIPTIFVAIRGAIAEPDTYEMPAGARTQDLIDTAQGITPNADLADINIAATLIDGSVLTIPSKNLTGMVGDTLVVHGYPNAAELNVPPYTRSGWQIPTTPPKNKTPTIQATHNNAPATASVRININTATAAQLETLPGIGPKTATKIIAFRNQTPFKKIQDLQRVSGIGLKRFEAVQHLIAIH